LIDVPHAHAAHSHDAFGHGPVPALLITMVVLGLGARLICGALLPADDTTLSRLPDQREYLELARNVLAGNGLQFFDPRFGQSVHAGRAPLYPIFLALCGASVHLARAAQALIDSSTIIAVWLLARRWLRGRATLVAALFVAFNPFLIYFSALILSETLFTALLAWGMALLPRRSLLPRVAALLMLALAVLDRPETIVLPALLAMAVPPRSPAIRPRPFASAAAALLVTLALLLPWAIRNRLDPTLHRWVFTTTNRGITLYDGFNPAATGASDQRFVQSMPQLRTMNEITRNQYLTRQATDYIVAHPARAAELTILKVLRTWSPIPLSDEYRRRWLFIIAAIAFSLPLMLLTAIAVAGMILRPPPLSPLPDGHRGPNFSGRAAIYCLLPALYFTLVHGMSVGSLRYRIPGDVPMAVVAASCIAAQTARRARLSQPHRATAATTARPTRSAN